MEFVELLQSAQTNSCENFDFWNAGGGSVYCFAMFGIYESVPVVIVRLPSAAFTLRLE